MSWLDKATLADPNDLRPSVAKVDLLLAAARTEPALAAARELQTQAPNSPIALQVLARTQLASGDQVNAIGTYRRLVSVAPDLLTLTTS